MRVIVVGLGIQGRKRRTIARGDVVATVDPVVEDADWRRIEEVPLDRFDAACVCVPDDQKIHLVEYLLSRGKHVLVEKPLLADDDALRRLDALATEAGVACYTAYNHRFEPHLMRLKTVLDEGSLGELYVVRMFYGNGTARDVRESAWRDRGHGVLPDLGSHLLDLVHFFFGALPAEFVPWAVNQFENRSSDHVLFGSASRPVLELESTLLSWRNTFWVDVFGERGSAHVCGLCKWGPSIFRLRRRVLPSGRPDEQTETVERPDPTWAAEYEHFLRLCATGGTNLANDRWINNALDQLRRRTAQELPA